jgi:hypothetical protein
MLKASVKSGADTVRMGKAKGFAANDMLAAVSFAQRTKGLNVRRV